MHYEINRTANICSTKETSKSSIEEEKREQNRISLSIVYS